MYVSFFLRLDLIRLLFHPAVLQGVAALNAKITKCSAVSHIKNT